MKHPPPDPLSLTSALLRFSWRVLTTFLRNRGLLMAGGVAYNALLSMIPFLALAVTGLSFVMDEQLVLKTVADQLNLLVPRYASPIIQAVQSFLRSRHVVGVVGFAVLIFFSSIAFRMLEEALSEIFHKARPRERRRLWVSLLLPYLYVTVLGVGLLCVTLLMAWVDALDGRAVQVFGLTLSLTGAYNVVLRLLSYLGLVILFSSAYKVLPPVKVSSRRAVIGGLAAATLWELSGRLLVYYFSTISLVNVVYGSLATVVVVLLSMELATIILLLGAQVIAELERSAAAGLPWYKEP